jgi:hypothetical protein
VFVYSGAVCALHCVCLPEEEWLLLPFSVEPMSMLFRVPTLGEASLPWPAGRGFVSWAGSRIGRVGVWMENYGERL